MAIEIKIPVIGESVTEATLSSWSVEDGDFVEEGDILCEIESDKASLELPAEVSGTVTRSANEGDDLPIGAVIGTIEEGEGAAKPKPAAAESAPSAPEAPAAASSDKTVQHASPAARKILDEKGVSADQVQGSGKDG